MNESKITNFSHDISKLTKTINSLISKHTDDMEYITAKHDKLKKKLEKQKEEIIFLSLDLVNTTTRTVSTLWEIKKLRQKIVDAKKDKQVTLSNYFTSSYGYRLELVLYLHGYGPHFGKNIVVFLRIVPGEYDKYLPWPVKLNACFTILGESYIKSMIYNVEITFNTSNDSPEGSVLSPITLLTDSEYVTNNSLKILCFIQSDSKSLDFY